MFKNPLKYQKGGTAASQEQLVQLFQAAAENAQVDPQQLVQKASEIGQDEEAAAQFMQGLQLCAQGDPEGIKFIKSLFQKPTFRRGGKIYDFICKHSKGGNINGCGCKEDGGKVAKVQEGGNWFTNATIGAAMAENPSVMTASGWRRDNSGNMVQDAISEPGVDKLRNNLAAISTLSFTHPSNVVLNSTISRLLPALGTLKYFPTFGIHAALEGAGTSMQKKETPNPVAGNRFKAPTNYYNEKGWQISEEDALRRKNRTFYTEEPTASGNLSWSNNEMAKQLMWPGVQQEVQYNQPVGHYIDEYGNMHDFSVEGNDLTRYNNRKAQWKKCGGKIKKAQFGMPNMPLNPNVTRMIYDKIDTLLTPANKWEKEYGTPVIGGIGLPAYVSPVAQEIELAKLIGNRIPTQGKRVPYYGKVKVNPKRKPVDYDIDKIYSSQYPLKTNNTASGIQMEAEHPEMLDYDIDKTFARFNNNIEIPDFSKVKLTDSWWDRNGEGLLWALPAVGIPATLLGQEIANKYKNKNKNPGGGSR